MSDSSTLDCGDHGTYDAEYNLCRCTGNWQGDTCRLAPPTTFKCNTSDAAFRAKHGGGDKDCGMDGVYGICQPNGTCSCVNTGRQGPRCTVACFEDNDCGGAPQEGVRQGKGRCSKTQCECMNGWSGFQCRTAPKDGKCVYDGDCGFGSAVNGKCVDGSCVCTPQTTAEGEELMYTGKFCETPRPSETPDTSSPAEWKEHLDMIIQSVLSDTTGYFMAIDKFGSYVANKALTAAAAEYLSAKMASKLGQEGVTVATKEAVEAVAKMLPEEAATKLMAEMVAREAMEVSLSELSTFAATAAVEAGFPPLGWILLLANVLQVFGMILDTIDVRGLSEQMMQGVLTQYKLQYQNAINQSAVAIKYGVSFPRPFLPTETTEFQAQMASKKVRKQMVSDAAEYLSYLAVNSAGETIRPLFASLAETQMVEKKKKYAVYWSMSGGNVDVFDRLIQYGWVLWVLLSVLVVSIVLICVFSAPAVQAKLKK